MLVTVYSMKMNLFVRDIITRVDSYNEMQRRKKKLLMNFDEYWFEWLDSRDVEWILLFVEEEEHVVKPAVVTSALRFGPSAFGPPTDKLLPRLTLLQQVGHLPQTFLNYYYSFNLILRFF